MPTLNVSDFSCLREATFDLARVNVLIGPQGSGKSVTTKLFYFFTDILPNSLQGAEKGQTLEEVKRSLAKQFCIWFPPEAWGSGRFNINYSAGDFYIRILRKKKSNRLSDEVAIKFSDWFEEFYRQALNSFQSSRSDDAEIDDLQFSAVIDRQWRAREIVTRKLSKSLGGDFFSQQTFIPAGRAFFTSIGRLVAGFEQVGSLDPVTIKFARLFASLRDRRSARSAFRTSRLSDETRERRSIFMDKIFGGEIRVENENEFVETLDGRRVPFTSLSSGQQELLPMWSLIEYFMEIDSVDQNRVGRRNRNELVYIEEPEAHLFPSAQSLLMEFLIGSIVPEKGRRSIVITTHSPYIMSKLNLFLKAGQLSRRKKKNTEINEIVPRSCWLHSSQLSAMSINSGTISNLLDEEGLIDGTYLDDISEDISRDFMKLLMIEEEISSV